MTAKTESSGAELARLIAAQSFVHTTMSGARMAAPLLALREGYSAAAVGVLMALFGLAPVFLSLAAGRLADRHGVRRPVGLSVIFACGGTALAVVFPVFPVLCLVALLTGGASAVASIALQRHVGRVASGGTQLRQVFSWLSLGPAISNFVGPFLAGVLIDHAGFRAAFLVLALFPLVTWLWVRKARELAPAAVPAHAADSTAWTLLREPAFRRLLALNWVLSSCWDVHTFLLPVLGYERGLSASVIGSLLGVFAIASAAVRVVLPLVADRLREWKVILWAMMATAAVFGVYPLMPTPLTMGLCSMLLGVALGSVQPMVMSMLHQITPEHRLGEALGLRMMAINASGVLMPMMFGVVGSVIGVGSVFWVVGGVVGASARLPLGMRNLRRRHP